MKISNTMKKILILLGLVVSLTAATVVLGQGTEGVITYEVTQNMHRRIPKEREQMKAMVPEFRKTKDQVFFTTDLSLQKPVIEDAEEEMSSSSGHGGVVIRMQAPQVEIFLDNSTQIRTVMQEFMGKNYLIEDTLKVAPWKFGTETKTVAGYECKQAYYTDESRPEQKMEVTAWYTDQLRPFLGPERFHSLPGTILAVDVNSGERVIVAEKVEMRSLKKNELTKPTKGIRTTQAEYRRIVDEQMKKMGGSGGIIIRN
jgi:GLPGLI family protein